METIKSVFDRIAKDVRFDAALIERITAYEHRFVNRNEDHIAFFGSNLMGVHPLRFRTTDRDNWFMDVLEIDEIELQESLHALEVINVDWKRQRDVMNITCVWMLHQFLHSKHLSPAQKEDGMVKTMLVLQYKFLGSLMSHWFQFPADSATMLKAMSELSRKFALKKAGSWSVLLLQRAQELASQRSIHRPVYDRFNDDKRILGIAPDIQQRLKEIVKSMSAVFYRVKAAGGKIASEKSVMDIDGTAVVKDKTRRYSTYIRYTHEIISDRNSFIRDELIDVISDAIGTMPPAQLRETLEWMSLNHRVEGVGEVEELVNETLIFAFEYATANRSVMGGGKGIMPLLTKLRSLYMASRMADPTLLRTKELSEKIVAQAVKTKSASVIASIRTGVQLYVVLRALAMPYYQN